MSDFVAIAFLSVAGAAVIALTIWAGIAESDACKARGGHIISKSTVGTGVSASGNVVTTVGSIQFCISDDGRILK